MNPADYPRYSLFELNYADMDYPEALDVIGRAASEKKPLFCAFINADCVNIAYKNADYKTVLQHVDYLWCDGTGVRYACKKNGTPLKCNLNGTDLFPLLCAYAGVRKLKIYLLGSKEGVADRCAEKMKKQFPDVEFAGTRSGYFATPEEEPQAIETINGSGADILLVGMGAPHQELFLSRHAQNLHIPVRMGVGGLFDFYSGDIKRAPLWMRRSGMEWFWRFLMQPKRLFKRYFIGNVVFLLHCRTLGKGAKNG